MQVMTKNILNAGFKKQYVCRSLTISSLMTNLVFLMFAFILNDLFLRYIPSSVVLLLSQ